MSGRLNVMVSSTERDLPEHRKQVIEACHRAGMFPLPMDNLPPDPADAAKVAVAMVDRADIYVGIFAYRYGYVPKGSDISVTEMQYDRAVERGIPCLIFLMHEDHLVTAKDVETGPGAEKLAALKKRLSEKHITAFFKSPDDLRGHALHSLVGLLKQMQEAELLKQRQETSSAKAKKATVFISYRREDSEHITGRLYDRLEPHFGRENVFFDVDVIPFGVDFREHLDQAVGQCEVLLAIIGEHWLEARFTEGPKEGKRRLDDSEDFVHIEIESALARGIPVIPVLVGRARMPSERELPEGLRPLVYRNAAEVRTGRDFHDHVDRLIRGIEYLLEPPTKATSRVAQP